MNSILSYPSRGKWGKSSYRGNCTGHIIKDLLEFYQPKKFVEVFSGGGTGKDVAIDLGIKNSVHLDLNNGWNGLIHEIPTGSDFTFSHPPYWDIVKYESQRGTAHEDDLSNNMSYEEFITKLDKVNSKIYAALVNGGRHAFLCGDVRKNKKYYSIIKDMAWIGDLEIHMIKEQHNTVSGRKSYNGKFIPIAHEHLLVFIKNQIWQVPIKFTVTKDFDLRNFENMTWRDLVQGALEYLGGESDLTHIYEIVADSKKAKKNNHWKEKVRQVLQVNDNFQSVVRGIWKLSVA
ncbi:hypothetical protein MXL46_13830 [Heyndrickxia sporothermodurans]|uniref:hypothetical protein n=1 Tax=Heyndrickxia sporothermodurans TaxID=46224 RepID=UPI002DBA7FBA|nr:hypothetical protein [Heyndrickxia sporothermodurans]MEB6550170.1 hypothetical protein [Heyndrickxia sporothermodurans]